MALNRPMMLQYDIPKVNGRDAVPNPSDVLWECRAVRTTDSVWVVMEKTLARPRMMMLLDNFTRHGVIWFAIPFDAAGTDQLRAMALWNIRRELAAKLEAARVTRAEADTQFDDESNDDFKARRRLYIAAASGMERRVKDMLTRVARAGLEFGITAADLDIGSAVNEVELIAGNMRARAAAFARAHGILTRRAPGHEITRGLSDGSVPPQIASDFLREIDEPEAADDIFGSFGTLGDM